MKLRTAATVLATTFFGVHASYEKIAGYEPGSQVTDHNALDLDQAAMETELGTGVASGYESAKKIYMEGGNSKSFAEVTLSTPLMMDIEKSTPITGTAVDGTAASGKAYSGYSAGDSVIKVQYITSDVQNGHVKCKVGGLTSTKVTDGCLEASGTLNIDGTEYSYSYDVDTDNNNGRTIQGFSTGAKKKMYDGCPGCPYPESKIFFDYFGDFDYGDKWVTAALMGDNVQFTSGKGSAMFKDVGYTYGSGLKEAVKKGTVYFNIFMYVIREYYDAIDDCKLACAKCNDDAVHAWDEGVAFYTGSLEGTEGGGSSKLLYELAEKRCKNFGTCTESGAATVNENIFELLDEGKAYLEKGECAPVEEILPKIISQMYVPLIQGALRYAYRQQMEETELEKKNAEGVTFMTAVLPKVDSISSSAADTIYEEMKASNTYTKDFAAVKAAFESVYDGIGITCADVGGLLSDDGSYFEGMEACGGVKPPSSDEDKSSGFVKTFTYSTVFAIGSILASFL